MKSYLEYRAGPGIFPLIKEQGLRSDNVGAFAGPAGGPKWFVSVGFDKTLIKSRFLEQAGRRVLLAGSSAGAWRCLAMVCKDPLDAYEKLRIAYSRNIFTTQDNPLTISQALRSNVAAFLGERDISHILAHPHFDVAIHAVRARGPAASENLKIQASGLIAAFLMNVISPRAMNSLFERIVFTSRTAGAPFSEDHSGPTIVGLTRENLSLAALATGSLPYIVAGVTDIPGAPPGTYRDGGVRDYQLNQDYSGGGDGVTLFFHYQERIVPGWFDKKLFWRSVPRNHLRRLLQVFPSSDFLELLPDRRLPDRNDFIQYADDPAERIRRWDEVSRVSDVLGEQFIEDVESGRIRDRVKPF